MSSRQAMFFATRADLVAMLREVESASPLIQYTPTGHHRANAIAALTTLRDVPDLGEADADSAIACRSYLVTEVGQPVHTRSVASSDGVRYIIDQFANPDSVTLTPAGRRGDGVLLYGRVATASDTARARALFGRFRVALRRHFEKLQSYHVGTEARQLLGDGARLTLSLQTPRSHDLTP